MLACIIGLPLCWVGALWFEHRNASSALPYQVSTSTAVLLTASSSQVTLRVVPHADKYVQFVLEAYDKVRQVHWKERNEEEMAMIFLDAYLQNTKRAPGEVKYVLKNRDDVVDFLVTELVPLTPTEKSRIAVSMVKSVLRALEPVGRNELMTQKETTVLRQKVSNIHPEKDLYAEIGVTKDSPVAVVEQKFSEKKAILEASPDPSAKVQLENLTYAKNVIATKESRVRYDTNLIEPTVFHRVIGSHILTLYVSRIAPTTKTEIEEAMNFASTTPGLTTLILDLRGNIGGALDFPLYFFGSFLGKDAPVLFLRHQSTTWSERTITPISPVFTRYTKKIVLVDRGTQSTAEVVAGMFEKHQLGVLVGERTAGWGTVENTYPMETRIEEDTNYSLFLVHSLTLQNNDMPIQGIGVEPTVNVTKSGWETKLQKALQGEDLSAVLRDILQQPPQR